MAAARGEQARAGALFEQAREGYLAAGDEAGAAAVERHAQMHCKDGAKPAQSGTS